MSPYFSTNQIIILHALVLGAALLQRFNTNKLKKIRSDFLKAQEEDQQNDSSNMIEYIHELSLLQAEMSLVYFYLTFIAILLVVLYTH